MTNKAVFNEIVSDYETGRPGYSSELYKDIVEYSMIKKVYFLESLPTNDFTRP